MLVTKIFSRVNKTIIYACFIWALLWLLPWGRFLSFDGNQYIIFLLELIKLFVALVLFILPGAVLYTLIRQKNNPLFEDPLGILPIGFSFSVTIIAIVGIVGRLYGFSFDLVRNLFMFIGLAGWVVLAIFRPDFKIRKGYISVVLRSVFENTPLMMALVLAVLMTITDYLFFVDDLTYLAYLTNWQNAAQLNFINIVHRTNAVEFEGFWLAMYPMGQALLADLSGVPGILMLSNYLEVFLVPLAVITLFWFGRALGMSSRAAGFSSLIQIALYAWMMGEQWPVGFWFFANMAEDKVSAVFLLAPVFFFFVLNYIQRPSTKDFILTLLAGFGLALTHPVILLFACIISSGLGLVAWITKRSSWREVLKLALIVASLLMPFVLIRLNNYSPSTGFSSDIERVSLSFQVERYTRVVNEIFYGLNPEVLMFLDLPFNIRIINVLFQIFRLFPIVLALTAGLLAFVNLKKGPLYWYIVVCVTLIGFAAIPYTGWILGYFSNARLISRTSWFSPLGLAGALVFPLVIDWFKTIPLVKRIRKKYAYQIINEKLFGLALCFIFICPMLFIGFIPRVPYYFKILNHNRQLAHIGAYIDRMTDASVTAIAVDYADTQILPGISAHTYLISFREEKPDNGHNQFLTTDEIHERIRASNIIRELENFGESSAEKCELIKEYEVRYVVADIKDADPYIKTIGSCGVVGEKVYQTMDLVLMELK